MAQTLEDIEVICVDDASTDTTCDVIEQFVARDSRIRLLRQTSQQSPYQARRVGIEAAKARFVLFLGGDDELVEDAARSAVERAQAQSADVLGFGVELIADDGGSAAPIFEADLQPQHARLEDCEVLPGILPVGRVAQGGLWGYLWDVELLRVAYDSLPHDLRLYRGDDVPITMVALANARRYISIPERLYRYYNRSQGSSRYPADIDKFRNYITGLEAIDAIAESIQELAGRPEGSADVVRSYDSARLSEIQEILRYAVSIEGQVDQAKCLELLCEKAGSADVVRAAAMFFRDALPFLAQHHNVLGAPPAREPRTILLFTWNLKSGGVQGVLVSQAKHLVDAGYRVVIGVGTPRGRVHELPEGVDLVVVAGRSLGEKLETLQRICRDYRVDYMIDHFILYYDNWPFYALLTETLGVKTIGWIHNFALRPLLDFNHRTAYLRRYLPLLDKVVTLSPTDVAFWRSQGVEHVVYLPNPPSPWLLEQRLRGQVRNLSAGPMRLVWWGRIQQHTKRVRELIDIAGALRQLGTDFRLSIVGPDSDDLTMHELREEAAKQGVDDVVVLTGPLQGDDLLEELEQSDAYVSTSVIEGYPLTLIEAQALGMPVAMYELPWLAMVKDNGGLITSRQGDRWGLAQQISALSRDSAAYAQLSQGSLDAAARALGHDFTELYSQLLTGTLPGEYSPERTLEMSDLLMDRAIDFHEQNVIRINHQENRSEAGPSDRVALDQQAEARRLKTAVLDARQKVSAERAENQRLTGLVDELQNDASGGWKKRWTLRTRAKIRVLLHRGRRVLGR